MGWFSRKQKEKIVSHLPAFLLELDQDGNILLSASWAKPENTDELASIVKRTVGFLALIGNGKLLPLFQHAISKYADNHNDEDTAKAILVTLDKLIRGAQQEYQDGNKPIVSPTEAFKR